MQRLWTAALPALPLYQRVQIDVADARVRELRPQPTRQPITWNVARWPSAGRRHPDGSRPGREYYAAFGQEAFEGG
jgi:hypothetical protein